MPSYDFDALSEYQDIIEEAMNGRTDGHRCPKCSKGVLIITVDEDVKMRIECPECRQYFEGRFA